MEEPIFIALMGLKYSGKSDFIRTATGDDTSFRNSLDLSGAYQYALWIRNLWYLLIGLSNQEDLGLPHGA